MNFPDEKCEERKIRNVMLNEDEIHGSRDERENVRDGELNRNLFGERDHKACRGMLLKVRTWVESWDLCD